MFIKRILLLISAATVLQGGAAFAADSWQNATWGATGRVVSIATDSVAGNSRFYVEFKVDNWYRGSAGVCPFASDTVYFSITNTGYSTTGTVQQQKQDMWKNLILLAKSTGSKLSADVGTGCELWDLRIL